MSVETTLENYFDENISDVKEYIQLTDSNVGNNTIKLDVSEVRGFSEEVYKELIQNPIDIQTMAEEIVEKKIGEILEKKETRKESEKIKYDPYIAFINLPEKKLISKLRAEDIGKLMEFDVTVERTTRVKPEFTQIMFKCTRCGSPVGPITQIEEKIKEPSECPECESNTFRANIQHDDTHFIDKQRIKLQERTEDLSGATKPESIKGVVTGDYLTGIIEPGERITVVGVVRLAKSISENDKTERNIEIEGLNIEKTEENIETRHISDQEAEKIETLVDESDDVLRTVVESIAPSVKGYEQEKRGIATQLFGGVTKIHPDGSRFRGDIHVLLLGDPGTAKSTLLDYVNRIAPRSVHSSGKGSTAAGLTASVVQDDLGDGQQWTLEGGTLVLADKGIATVDELDKMRSEDRDSMHDALESQEITISKADINTTLKTRCSLLAAANPKNGRFYENEPYMNQINLEPPLISRFDLMFLIKDIPDTQKDESIAKHVFRRNESGWQNEMEEDISDFDQTTPTIDKELMTKYIAYARQEYTPKLPHDRAEEVAEWYSKIRGEGSEDNTIPITARKLEAAIRLSEAIARMNLSDIVTEAHIQQALGIIVESLEDTGVDKDGNYDANVARGGRSQRENMKELKVHNLIKGIIVDIDEHMDEKGVPEEMIIDEVQQYDLGYSEQEIRSSLKRLDQEAEIYRGKDGYSVMPQYVNSVPDISTTMSDEE